MSNQQAGALGVGRQFTRQSLICLHTIQQCTTFSQKRPVATLAYHKIAKANISYNTTKLTCMCTKHLANIN